MRGWQRELEDGSACRGSCKGELQLLTGDRLVDGMDYTMIADDRADEGMDVYMGRDDWRFAVVVIDGRWTDRGGWDGERECKLSTFDMCELKYK